MRRLYCAASVAALCMGGQAMAQTVPATPDEVARPGGTLPGNPEIALVEVASGFLDPTNVTNAGDGSGRIFVVERAGRVKVVDGDGNVSDEPFIDLTTINPLGSDVQTGFVEQGLYSIAFHPDYSNNGHVFLHYASLPFNGDGVIVRVTAENPGDNVISSDQINSSAKVVMRIEQPYYNHNGGQIAFGPDGYLYVGSGDGGWEGDPLQAGSDLATLLGKMIRIDVDTEDHEAYAIPADNPYLEAQKERLMVLFGITEEEFATIRTKAEPEIWSYGVRNPYEFAFDPDSGDLFIADVGQNHWEEIIYQPASSEGGEYYGWPDMQAAFCHPLTGDPAESECAVQGVLPAAMYPHSTEFPGAEETNEGGCSVQGFGVANYGGMDGVYLAGDWCSGRVFGLGWDEAAGGWQLQEMLQTGLQFTAGGYDEDNNVLAVNANNFYLADQGPDTNPPGGLWRVVPAAEVPEGAVVAETVAE